MYDPTLDRQVILGDCLEVLPTLPEGFAHAAVMDPPYGIAYRSGKKSTMPRTIAGDADTGVRDAFLAWWGARPALVFGSWKRPRPAATRALLVWDTKGALGMGDLSIPWKPAHQEIYVLGRGFAGRRTTDVLTHAPVQSLARNGRQHPHQKPIALMVDLLRKCPLEWTILDPFCGVGSTGVACVETGHRFVGIEQDEGYVAIARERIAQAEMEALV